jgi:hypothetical protein
VEINYGDPLAGLTTCEEKDRGKLFGYCVTAMGTHNAIHSYIDHKLHIAPDGGFKKIIDMTREFRGLIQFKTFLNTLRINYPSIFAEIKEAGGHFNE